MSARSEFGVVVRIEQDSITAPAGSLHRSHSPANANRESLRQGDAKVFKKCSQMKLQMKREALFKLNQANEQGVSFDTARVN